jgi:putative PIN family toxin of toxin-antitoxin system
MPIRATLDTNVLVSGLLAEGGAPHRILDAWIEGRYSLGRAGARRSLITSLYLLQELAHVLSRPRIAERLRLSEDEIATLLAAFLDRAEVTPGALQLPGVTRDPKDDPVVACAVEGKADYIVSGDQDLLVLDEYEGIHIVSPRQFVEILGT